MLYGRRAFHTFFFPNSPGRLSFVDLRWVQLYVSLVLLFILLFFHFTTSAVPQSGECRTILKSGSGSRPGLVDVDQPELQPLLGLASACLLWRARCWGEHLRNQVAQTKSMHTIHKTYYFLHMIYTNIYNIWHPKKQYMQVEFYRGNIEGRGDSLEYYGAAA